MSREIFLYSKDKKYKCAVELADGCDHFGCPGNSVMILFEERKDGTYIIAQARDKRLETEKDRIIADPEAKLEESEADKKLLICDYESRITRHQELMSWLEHNNDELKQQLAEKENTITTLIEDSKTSKELLKKELAEKNEEIAYLTKQVKKFNNEAQKYFEDAYCNAFRNQDKISFAVEQLEQVRKLVDELLENCGDKQYKVWEVFDNQIKQLKEGK